MNYSSLIILIYYRLFHFELFYLKLFVAFKNESTLTYSNLILPYVI
jgi:hypothetical protein